MILPSIEPFRRKLEAVGDQLANPAVFADPRKAASLSREHQELTALVETGSRLEVLRRRLNEAEELLRSADPEMHEIAAEERSTLLEEIPAIERNLLERMLPADPNDSRNTVVEIRAGAGGDEASLFAGDLFRMYSRLAERRGWRTEMMHSSANEAGGLKEVIFLVAGDAVYRHLRFESGVHRVQRIPVTESGGRIHTSTATVAVLPEAAEVDVAIDPADLEITVSRASGPGGQGVNTTDSAVQILHKPTGLIVNCADERSQLKNKNKAMQVLRARLLKLKEEEEAAKMAAERKGQVGSGDRSERIRTYNFPQSRLTDHRIGLTLHSLEETLDGDLDAVISALQQADTEARLAAFLPDGAEE